MPPLVLERDAGRRAQAEAVRVVGDVIDAEPLADLVEDHVARAHQRLVYIHVAVAARAPAAKVRLPKKSPPPQKMVVNGVMTPSSSAAAAITTL